VAYRRFVTTRDGVVSLKMMGQASSGDIGGCGAEHPMLMELCRGISDVVIIRAQIGNHRAALADL
jgi:hypothetical protein